MKREENVWAIVPIVGRVWF